jgi:putative DNA methylase
MSEQEQSERSEGRPELPIERGFPIERINEIAEKESRAKQWYRPIYTMHKWWARRPGCLFRAITLYSLLDEDTTLDDVEVCDPGEHQMPSDNGTKGMDLIEAIEKTGMDDPELLWEFYPKEVRIKNKKVLDPFMGGGTSLVEASRFGVESVGVDLNPVAWFVTKKELDAGRTAVEDLEDAFEQVKDDVADEILQYYKTPCPNGDHTADVMYNFWVKELDCVSCGQTVPLFTDYWVADGRYTNDEKDNVLCPECGAVTLVDDWREESSCGGCGHRFVPKNGNVTGGGFYNCPGCGQKEAVMNGIAEQGGYDLSLYAIEYYCAACDEQGRAKNVHKGYKKAAEADTTLFEEAKKEWHTRTDLHTYVPDETIPEGHMTSERNPVFDHGYEQWTDMFNERQLLSLSKILKSIHSLISLNEREFLLTVFSNSLCTNNAFTGYDRSYNKIQHIFKTNSFDPPHTPCEGNVWGTRFGRGTFESIYEMVKNAVHYANAPTDRYVEDGETRETPEFSHSIGQSTEVSQDDMRTITAEDAYDAVITDPPYYDNIIYSEVADYFYVWQKILLEGVYPGFDQDKAPRTGSIVTNPFLDKTAEDFEHEMSDSFEVINRALKDDGILAFTYHHSNESSWGELLTSLCETGFEVTATYPINSDLNKFIGGEAVSFDIVIVARPFDDPQPISWNSLQRRIARTAQATRETLAETRDLASGDIGVIEMGKCFQEYSPHHGEVHRAGETMTAKEVVDEIYGIIQENALGEQDVYLAVLEALNPTYDDLSKHLRHSDASKEQMREMCLFRVDDNDFVLCDWSDEKRQAYVQRTVEEDTRDPTDLDRVHFLRYRYETGRSTKEYLACWNIDELQELCEGLAEATQDKTYLKMLGVDESLETSSISE